MNDKIEERSDSFFEDNFGTRMLEEEGLQMKEYFKEIELASPSMKEEDSSEGEEELSCYALDIEKLEDLQSSHSHSALAKARSLRIMHCGNLQSLKGLHLFYGVRELNLSSNNIMSMAFLDQLSQLKVLNLSCNKITQVFNLQNAAPTLTKLILSHNRIVQLTHFKELGPSSVVEFIDLNDNYIGDLGQLSNLSSLSCLREIIFQQKNSSNPMCDFENYEEAVAHYLPQVRRLDSKDLQVREISGKSLRQENVNPNVVREKERTKGSTGVMFTGLDYKKELLDKDQLIEKLYGDIKELHQGMELHQRERNEAIEKFEKNDGYWKVRLEKLEEENNKMFAMNKSIKEDNRDIMLQLDKLSKRNRQLEGERQRDLEQNQAKDQSTADLTKQLSFLTSSLEEAKEEIQILKKDVARGEKELSLEQERHRETKDQLKECSDKCSGLYQDMMSTNKNGMERWNTIQSKYEESQAQLHKQVTLNEELNQKILDYKELNNQLEYSWGQKYASMLRDKEAVVASMKDQSEQFVRALKGEFERKLEEKQGQFREDFTLYDAEMKKQNKELSKKLHTLKDQHQKLQEQSQELKELLELAVQSDNKHKAMMEELKLGVKGQKESLEKEKEQVKAEKEVFLQERKSVKEEVLQLKATVDELEYCKKELGTKVQSLSSHLEQKSREFEQVIADFDQNKRLLKECQSQLQQLRDQCAGDEEALRREVEDLRAEVEELSELVKTKDKMLDDQNNTIGSLKQAIRERDEEIQGLNQNRNKYKDYYEDKLDKEIEDNERLKSKNEELSQRLVDYEDEIEQMKIDSGDAVEQASALRKQLSEKEEIISYVEQEVIKIKEKQDQDKAEIMEREEVIRELREGNKELNKEIKQQKDIQAELIEKMKEYKKDKDGEIGKLKKELAKAEESIKLVVLEYEKQKKAVREMLR